MSVASPRREASRASISFRKGVPWQYATAGARKEVARLRAATALICGDAVNPPWHTNKRSIFVVCGSAGLRAERDPYDQLTEVRDAVFAS